ncbi:MAG: c-type cytochrome [Rhodobacteraceae bacterium]|nr:c-type cytochrome [Paracoccaceae bacterium]
MFDTMTFTKIVGGFCGALLVFLLGNWAAGALYTSQDAGGKQAYSIATADATAAPAASAAPAADFTTVYASADATKGASVFNKCKACHKVDGQNATGPHLNGVVGRVVASVDGFAYSDALKGLGGDWTPDRLDQWLTSPKAYAPGTKMGFAGLDKVEDRANVIAYLASLK